MASHKLNFIKAKLQEIPTPQPKDGSRKSCFDTYHDAKEKGLILIVTSGGAKTFYLYQKINNRPVRIKIGRFPDLLSICEGLIFCMD
jgi:hypothetical protein